MRDMASSSGQSGSCGAADSVFESAAMLLSCLPLTGAIHGGIFETNNEEDARVCVEALSVFGCNRGAELSLPSTSSGKKKNPTATELCPVMVWPPVQGVPRFVPDAPWDRLQVPRDTEQQ
ncbi:hypothetical protein AMELA_G00001010 [Ameiurus melas]|uniref:Uncharacterized protein n=1 Tax=Ameiurus melas TaxID=219545 RepID=A0A7J6BDZ3_AMEME|nr:hypothetical protein AMELA_G00001010 [Ameiurus melas]